MNSNRNQPRHFLSLMDLTPDELRTLIARASELKKMQHAGEIHEPLKNRTLGMIFEKSSTRTRVSFEAGMTQLGGHALFLSPRDTQLGRGEPIEDSARVMSRMVDSIMIRTFDHDTVEVFAANSKVPVINALTDLLHPCQLLADMQTYFEHRGDIQGKTVTWIGDGNNMCNSYINAARQFDFKLNIACPEGYDPIEEMIEPAAERCTIFRDPMEAAQGSDLVVTDVWASMGQEEEQVKREKAFAGFQVNDDLMAQANSDALFMHCLPAHRGEEVTASVIDRTDS
ncbi:MAG: ornithine carbamoyltransferase, partial [Candidatus Sedimenticola sp. 6PFRAG1]